MNESYFNHCINNIKTLTDVQFILLRKKIHELNYKEFVSVNLDETQLIDICRYCKSAYFFKWGRRDGMQRYKCKTCKRTFNALTNTPLANLRKKDKWIDYALCLKQGLSVRKAAKKCNIHRNTSFRWRHRFLGNNTQVKANKLEGIVEMNSKIMFKSYKGSRNVPRKPRYRGLSKKQKELSKEKFTVFFSKNRASYVYDKIFKEVCDCNTEFSLDNIFQYDSLLFSKRNSTYENFTKNKFVQHTLVIKRGNEKKNKLVHLKNVDLYCAKLEEWASRFKGVATKYLDNYLSWYRFLDEFNMEIKPETILLRAKSNRRYKHQPLFVTEPNS